MIAVAAGVSLFGRAETPGVPASCSRFEKPVRWHSYRSRIVSPALIIEHSRRDANVVVNQWFLVVNGSKFIRRFSREQAEQSRLIAVRGHASVIAFHVKRVMNWFGIRGVVEIAADQEVDLGIGMKSPVVYFRDHHCIAISATQL